MEHNNERTIGLKQLRDLSRKHFPEIMSLVCKELNEETDRIALENARRFSRQVLKGTPLETKEEPKIYSAKEVQHPLRIRALEALVVELDLQQKRQNELLKEFSEKIQSLEDDLEGVKIKHAKLKGSTDAVLSSHDKKFADIKKINQTFIELFRGIDENVRTIFFQTKKD